MNSVYLLEDMLGRDLTLYVLRPFLLKMPRTADAHIVGYDGQFYRYYCNSEYFKVKLECYMKGCFCIRMCEDNGEPICRTYEPCEKSKLEGLIAGYIKNLAED